MNLISELETLNQARLRLAKMALHQVLTEVFEENPDINIISWGQKNSEYNDEGMYPGIQGPVFNYNFSDKRDWDDLEWDIIMGYGYRRKDHEGWSGILERPQAAKKLKEMLEGIGEDLMVAIMGNEDEYIISANRQNTTKLSYKLTSVSCSF